MNEVIYFFIAVLGGVGGCEAGVRLMNWVKGRSNV